MKKSGKKQPKQVTWSPTVFEPVSKFKENSPKRKRQKKNATLDLTEAEQLFAKGLTEHVELGLFKLLFSKLDDLKKKNRLGLFMSKTNYSLFQLGLEHKNLQIINYLIENLSKEQVFEMVSNEDFKFFKEFIATHYQREVMDDTEEKILAAILTIESNGQLNEIVQANLVTSKSDQTAKLQP